MPCRVTRICMLCGIAGMQLLCGIKGALMRCGVSNSLTVRGHICLHAVWGCKSPYAMRGLRVLVPSEVINPRAV